MKRERFNTMTNLGLFLIILCLIVYIVMIANAPTCETTKKADLTICMETVPLDNYATLMYEGLVDNGQTDYYSTLENGAWCFHPKVEKGYFFRIMARVPDGTVLTITHEDATFTKTFMHSWVDNVFVERDDQLTILGQHRSGQQHQ